MTALKIRVTLQGSKPPIFRTLAVPEGFTFRDLEASILTAFEHPPVLRSSFYIPSADILVSDTMGIELGSDIESEWRRGGEPVADHRGEAMIYVFGEYDAPWRFDVVFMGTDRSHTEPYPRLLKSGGPSPDPFFHSPDEFLECVRDPSSCPEAGEEGVVLSEPDASVVDAFLSDITAGSQGRLFSLLGDPIGGRIWADGPAVMPGGGFFDDMARYGGVDPGDVPYVPCDSPWPAYSDLSEEQLRWFLHWRSECSRGRPSETDRGYVWLYCAELADSIDVRRSERLLDELTGCLREYDVAIAVRTFRVALPVSRGMYPEGVHFAEAAAVPGAAVAFYSMPGGPRFSPDDADGLCRLVSEGGCPMDPVEFAELVNSVLSDMARSYSDRGTDLFRTLFRHIDMEERTVVHFVPVRRGNAVLSPADAPASEMNQSMMAMVPAVIAGRLGWGWSETVFDDPGLESILGDAVRRWREAHPEREGTGAHIISPGPMPNRCPHSRSRSR